MTEEHVIVGSPERDIPVKAIVHLEKVDLSKHEDGEKEIFKMRAKLYRYHVDEEDGSTWKERGIGDVRILHHSEMGTYRIVMRREKTLKLCLNHYLLREMAIQMHGSNEKALVWSTFADFSDGESKTETLCIRFGKAESATQFKEKFEECVGKIGKEVVSQNGEESDKLAVDLSSLNVKDEKESTGNTDSKGNTDVNKPPEKKDSDEKK